jgi:hypothetical protein
VEKLALAFFLKQISNKVDNSRKILIKPVDCMRKV